MATKDMSAEQLIRTIKSQAAEDALNGHEEFRCTAFGGELLSRIERGERAEKAMEAIFNTPRTQSKSDWTDQVMKIVDQWRNGNDRK